jgi:hypothetical protein
MTPVLGEFLGPAGEHIAAAVSFRGELPYSAQCGVVRQLDRLIATLARYLADLPLPDALDPARQPRRDAESRAAPARLALDRAAQSLRPARAGRADTAAGDAYPVVGHLAAAAGYLAAGRDLLHTHFADGPAGPATPTSYWAPVITSAPVSAALLSELAGYTENLASWITRQRVAGRLKPTAPTSALLALRRAEPWLLIAGTAIRTAQREHYPLPARRLLDGIPVNAPPPRPPLTGDESVADLCEHIPVTAERLRHATLAWHARARWSPSATSLSWRRDALACAITGHASELVLRTLTERFGHAGLEPNLAAQLRSAADHMAQAWQAWRAVTTHWDVVTTGAPRGTGLTPVAAEIEDLALRTGRLAYSNTGWTPACSDAALVRDLADLTQHPADMVTVLAAVHHGTDAVSRVAATDHQAVLAAAADSRLYVPVRLLPEKYDIPHPYTLAPPEHSDALLAAYDTAANTATRVTAVLDDLAVALDAPSSLLAAARQVTAARSQPRPQRDQQPDPQPSLLSLAPGTMEHALRELQIRDHALLLRAAVIDQAARDLVSEAMAKASSRTILAVPISPFRRTAPNTRQAPGPPSRTARQDTPSIRHVMQQTPSAAGVSSHGRQPTGEASKDPNRCVGSPRPASRPSSC